MKIKVENTNPNRFMRGAQEPDEQGLVYSKDGKRLLKATKNLSQITVKEGVKIICDHAFSVIYALEEIQLPKTVQYLGEGSFAHLPELKSITLPDSLLYLGVNAFCDSGLISIVIPNSVAFIGQRAFERCENLQSVALPSSLEEIENSVFFKCSSLTSAKLEKSDNFVLEDGILYNKDKTSVIEAITPKKNVVFPETVKSICEDAFSWRTQVESVKFSSCLTTVEDFAFSCCKSLKSVILPDSVKNIGFSSFSDCEKFDIVQLPDGLENLDEAFTECNIGTLVLPEKLPDGFLNNNPFEETKIKEIKTKSDRYYVDKFVVYDSKTREEVASFL